MLQMTSEIFLGPTIPLNLTPLSGARDRYLWNEGSDGSGVFNFVHSLSSWFGKWRQKIFLALPYH